MSYILDALKKSDRERRQGKPPGLNSIHDPLSASPKNSSASQRIKYILTATGLILLISIPAMTWFSTKDFTDSATPVVIEETRAITTTTTTEPEKNTVSTPTIASTPATTESLRDNNRISPPPPSPITTRSKKLTLLPDQTKPAQEKKTAVSLPDQKPPEIPDIKSLPLSIQTAIPDLNFAGHTYSDNPDKRMIIINDSILREGDKLNNTIRLVEITWTGVILDYNGEQFSVNID